MSFAEISHGGHRVHILAAILGPGAFHLDLRRFQIKASSSENVRMRN